MLEKPNNDPIEMGSPQAKQRLYDKLFNEALGTYPRVSELISSHTDRLLESGFTEDFKRLMGFIKDHSREMVVLETLVDPSLPGEEFFDKLKGLNDSLEPKPPKEGIYNSLEMDEVKTNDGEVRRMRMSIYKNGRIDFSRG